MPQRLRSSGYLRPPSPAGRSLSGSLPPVAADDIMPSCAPAASAALIATASPCRAARHHGARKPGPTLRLRLRLAGSRRCAPPGQSGRQDGRSRAVQILRAPRRPTCVPPLPSLRPLAPGVARAPSPGRVPLRGQRPCAASRASAAGSGRPRFARSAPPSPGRCAADAAHTDKPACHGNERTSR